MACDLMMPMVMIVSRKLGRMSYLSSMFRTERVRMPKKSRMDSLGMKCVVVVVAMTDG